ncbi:MAG: GHMP kinase [Chloroflexota bacterium]|nr:GHMP kinase [Chloroflexota bacterium]
MIVAHAPLRLSFGGGGTDLPAYYERYGGLVVSSAIGAACHVRLEQHTGNDVVIHSLDYQKSMVVPAREAVTLEEPLSLPRAVLQWFEQVTRRPSGITITMEADVPPGSGLGSSSAMTVALVTAIARHLRIPMLKNEIAAAACEIEIDILGHPIGRQDQYASALGGINMLTFSPGNVDVKPLNLPAGIERSLQDHLLLLSTQRTRDSASVLQEQRKASRSDGEVIARLHRIKSLAQRMADALQDGDIAGFGGLLDESWQLKRKLATGVTSADIDRWYALAQELGAYGGKIAGAGGGGFLLLCVPVASRSTVSRALQREGLRPLEVTFDHYGCCAGKETTGVSRRGDRALKREMQNAAILTRS